MLQNAPFSKHAYPHWKPQAAPLQCYMFVIVCNTTNIRPSPACNHKEHPQCLHWSTDILNYVLHYIILREQQQCSWYSDYTAGCSVTTESRLKKLRHVVRGWGLYSVQITEARLAVRNVSQDPAMLHTVVSFLVVLCSVHCTNQPSHTRPNSRSIKEPVCPIYCKDLEGPSLFGTLM